MALQEIQSYSFLRLFKEYKRWTKKVFVGIDNFQYFLMQVFLPGGLFVPFSQSGWLIVSRVHKVAHSDVQCRKRMNELRVKKRQLLVDSMIRRGVQISRG